MDLFTKMQGKKKQRRNMNAGMEAGEVRNQQNK